MIPEKLDILEWGKFPVDEMYKRGWFEGFSGSLDELKQEANELVEGFITAIVKKPTVALHRKLVRSGVQIDPYALLAWECRVLTLAAKDKDTKEHRAELLTFEWIDQLRKLSRLQDGPVQAKAMLEEAGISLIIEPRLPNTYLDGAAMLLNGNSPLIGMTLRYDRIDNFWFVLFHELIHIMYHLKKGKLENIFDDLDADIEYVKDEIELEADRLAGEALISSGEWDKALPRFTRSVESIQSFASKLGISPAIVAGRIRKESNAMNIPCPLPPNVAPFLSQTPGNFSFQSLPGFFYQSFFVVNIPSGLQPNVYTQNFYLSGSLSPSGAPLQKIAKITLVAQVLEENMTRGIRPFGSLSYP